MGSITDRINDDVRERYAVKYTDPLFYRYVESSLQGLLSCGDGVSYDTAHKAYQMAKYMMEIKEQYVS